MNLKLLRSPIVVLMTCLLCHLNSVLAANAGESQSGKITIRGIVTDYDS